MSAWAIQSKRPPSTTQPPRAAAWPTASGQAANFYAMFNIASCGDHVVASSSIYGGTYNLFAVTMKKMGVAFTFPDGVRRCRGDTRPGRRWSLYGCP